MILCESIFYFFFLLLHLILNEGILSRGYVDLTVFRWRAQHTAPRRPPFTVLAVHLHQVLEHVVVLVLGALTLDALFLSAQEDCNLSLVNDEWYALICT